MISRPSQSVPSTYWQRSTGSSKRIHPAPYRTRDLIDAPVLLAACGGDSTLLREMCQTLTTFVPKHLAMLRDALRDQDAPRLREAAHKSCGMLSMFSAVAGDLAGNLEELAAGTELDKAAAILEQLETIVHELVKQIDGMTVQALHRQAEVWPNPMGQPSVVGDV